MSNTTLNKTLMAVIVGGGALLGVGATAAPLTAPIPTLAPAQVQAVDWHDWHHYRGWWRHDHEARHRWHRWHDYGRYYGYRGYGHGYY